MPRHILRLGQALREVSRVPNSRLIVAMPPRHGKSSLVSHWFVAWYLSLHPDRRVILSSYAADYAATWGRKVRNTIDEHKDTLKIGISSDSSAADAWETTAGGGMVAAGVGGPITGRGADILIIDDPIKNSEEAMSATIRDKVWEWWQSTALTRLEPGGSAIIVMTRWHEDDLVGRILADEDASDWQEMRLPAIAGIDDPLGRQPGEALWPQRYDLDALDRKRDESGEYTWSALYQQDPPSLFGNAVYSNYSEEKEGNLDSSIKLNPLLPLQIAIDFNRNPGQYAVVGQHDTHAEIVTAFHVIHRPGMHIQGMVRELKRLIAEDWGGFKWPSLEVFGDATGVITSMKDGVSYWDSVKEEMKVNGIPFVMRVPSKNPGVHDRVQAFNNAMKAPDGRRRYRVHPQCKDLIRDFKRMRWDGDDLNKKDAKLSHPSDSDGYRVHRLLPIRKIERRRGEVILMG